MFSFTLVIRRYLYNSHLLYNLRIFIALAGCAAVPWWLNMTKFIIPLTLGAMAAALADLDDRLTGRLRNLMILLVCFFIASASTTLLFPYPYFFVIGLAVSTCLFTLLGALGQRYATIAFAALLIAVYTMLGASAYTIWYEQPLLLIMGATWYNLLALLEHLLFPIKPLQESLARCYEQLGNYLSAKADLFDPDVENDADLPMIHFSIVNSQLISLLNQNKSALLTRMKSSYGQQSIRRALHYYFIAQDIHERVSSSHGRQQILNQQLRHSDIMFRFQRLLNMQADACRHIAQSILFHQQYQHNPRFDITFLRLEDALSKIPITVENYEISKVLAHLLKNLKAIDAQLANIGSRQEIALPESEQNRLSEDEPTGWSEICLRISRHLTPQSMLFRHSIRMSVVLCCGYTLVQLTQIQNGYWILLTSLIVCQPNYNATRRRLALRIAGTVIGILIGLPILYFVPSLEGQLILMVIFGVLYFVFRTERYAHATIFITLLVLLCFNLLGEGFIVAIPRIYDTLIGCIIAWAAVSFIWPDWKFRQLSTIVRNTQSANCLYLEAILQQYESGKDNNLSYRIARRDAHNGNAELTSVISSMPTDPKISKKTQESAFHLLCLNQTLLSYISTLGAHRKRLNNPKIFVLLSDTVSYIDTILRQDMLQPSTKNSHALMARLDSLTPEANNDEQLVLQQIGLLLNLLPELTQFNLQLEHLLSTTKKQPPSSDDLIPS